MTSSLPFDTRGPVRPTRILIVDDRRSSLIALEATLEPLGTECVRAESGEAALRLLLDQEFALILLDVNMPGMNGFEVARIIRSRHRLRRTPIIFVTGEDRDDRNVLAAYDLGAVDFLFKPVVPEVLRAKASVFIDLSRQADVIQEHERREHARALELARRKWDEEALRQQMDQLAQLDRRKDQFLAVLGHELRNPLAPIVAGLELMKGALEGGSRDDATLRATRTMMARQVAHLLRLVDDVLDISRINSDKLQLRKERLSLREVVDHSITMSRPWMEQKRHALLADVPSEPLIVEGDRVRLSQTISNLLNNAARYTPPNGHIAIACRRVANDVEVRVTDDGEGIAADMLPRVFEPFTQDETTPSSGFGLGLGLAIVQKLALLHGGSVSVHSEGRGRGSEFVLRLPLASTLADTPAESLDAPPTQVSPGPDSPDVAAAAEADDGPRVGVALIDDNEDICEVLKGLLTAWGHTVVVAHDGVTGHDLILEQRPDVALIDIGLPGIDGYEVADRVKRSAGKNTPRLIAMTGFGQESDRRRAFEAGFDGHLVKPADATALRAVLKPIVR
jgi:signal transduction histidine kinase